MTPDDDCSFIGMPGFGHPLPGIRMVEISVTFTWDKAYGERLLQEWQQFYPDVRLGGPAYDDPGDSFHPGRFLKQGYVITSRGCCRSCWFCMAARREGPIRTLPIAEGSDILDNNLLACPRRHIEEVFGMLRSQRMVRFSGGLDCRLFRPWHAEAIRSLSLRNLWFAYDDPSCQKDLERAVVMLGLSREKMGCYVLAGYPGDTIEKAEIRVRRIYEIGCMPFAMLYRDEAGSRLDLAWRRWGRQWCRPALIKYAMKKENYGEAGEGEGSERGIIPDGRGIPAAGDTARAVPALRLVGRVSAIQETEGRHHAALREEGNESGGDERPIDGVQGFPR